MTEAKRKAIEKLQAKGHFKKIGRKGGNMTKKRKLAENPNYYAEIGHKSGMALLASRGVRFFSEIGKIGKRSKHHEG